jgi:uncharacterized protein (DUF2126 family)
MTDASDFETAVAVHDAALASRHLDIWIGNEPTFTDRLSSEPEWVTMALGEDKRVRAQTLLAHLAKEQPGSVVVRSIGRQYPGEALPRWSFGIYAPRDGTCLWSGPPDPVLGGVTGRPDVAALQARLATNLRSRGFRCKSFASDGDLRLVLTRCARVVLPDPAADPRLSRPSIHATAIPGGGPVDSLAGEGLLLVILSTLQETGASVVCVDLPAFECVETFRTFLAAVAKAANTCGLPSLVLRGFVPPVDASVCWTTVTPDPAVVEVNMAPYPSVLGFLRANRRAYDAGARVGLAPYRLHYNGAVADSGGGGQITVGGPSPERSPFFVHPCLLPRLLRYAQRHPALSYFFAHDFIGGSGQSVRPDEHGADALAELKLALALMDREPSPGPGLLWASFAPSLTDAVGNSHRAEINIEKLWNPHQTGRGQLGLVEFRAFRMQHTPESAAALAALLRAVLAMLIQCDDDGELVDWGAALHDRFALPFYLEADLRAVLRDLDVAGLPLGAPLRDELTSNRWRTWKEFEFGDFTLTVRHALDFWTLVGDATLQAGTSRLVDSSSRRIELAVRPTTRAGLGRLRALRLRVDGIDLPLRTEHDALGPVRLFGVRYRSFVPTQGLHPTLGSQTPLPILLLDPGRPDAVEVTLHDWRPDGAAYDGLPSSLADAQARRSQRCLERCVPRSRLPPSRTPPRGALSPWSLDLRYVPSSRSSDRRIQRTGLAAIA